MIWSCMHLNTVSLHGVLMRLIMPRPGTLGAVVLKPGGVCSGRRYTSPSLYQPSRSVPDAWGQNPLHQRCTCPDSVWRGRSRLGFVRVKNKSTALLCKWFVGPCFKLTWTGFSVRGQLRYRHLKLSNNCIIIYMYVVAVVFFNVAYASLQAWFIK